MKRTQLYFISAAILSLLLISCIDKQSKPEKGIVGKWEFVKVEPDVETSDSILTAKLSAEMLDGRTGKDLEGNPTMLIFSDNGILTINGNPATYGIKEDKLRFRIEGNVMLNDFSLKEDSLVVHIDVTEIGKKNLKNNMDIGDDVEIKKLIMIQHFVRK